MDIDLTYLGPVQAALEQWTDQRVIEDADLESLLLLACYGRSILFKNGYILKAWGVRQKGDQQLLHVKVTESGTPLVVFLTGETTTSCVRRFWDLYEDDRLTWVRDKYP